MGTHGTDTNIYCRTCWHTRSLNSSQSLWFGGTTRRSLEADGLDMLLVCARTVVAVEQQLSHTGQDDATSSLFSCV